MQNYLGRREYENFTKMTHFNNATTATTASRVAETCFKSNSHLLIFLPFSPIPQIKFYRAFFPTKKLLSIEQLNWGQDRCRLEICGDRRSCNIFVSCVNFSRKRSSFSHIYTVTQLHLNVNCKCKSKHLKGQL